MDSIPPRDPPRPQTLAEKMSVFEHDRTRQFLKAPASTLASAHDAIQELLGKTPHLLDPERADLVKKGAAFLRWLTEVAAHERVTLLQRLLFGLVISHRLHRLGLLDLEEEDYLRMVDAAHGLLEPEGFPLQTTLNETREEIEVLLSQCGVNDPSELAPEQRGEYRRQVNRILRQKLLDPDNNLRDTALKGTLGGEPKAA